MPEALPQPRKGKKKRATLSASPEQFEEAEVAWRETPTEGHLGDLLGFSILPPFRDRLSGIAKDVLDAGTGFTEAQRVVLQDLAGVRDREDQHAIDDSFGICNPHVQAQVREMRALLQANPRNPLVLLDLAQLQLASGKQEAAERILRGALSLSPNSRTALRTLARFYVHARDPERGRDLLRRHPRTPTDPWLIAGELALSSAAGSTPKFARKAVQVLKDENIARSDKTELAGAVGGIELASGHVKRARDFFRVALLEPNDNVLAQAITDRQALGIIMPRSDELVVAQGEPQALLAWQAGDIAAAEAAALSWHAQEPFSSRPLQLLTTMYSISRDHTRAIALARRGLIADQADAGLLTNLAYNLAVVGQVEEAAAAVKKLVALGGAQRVPYAQATCGLIAMHLREYEIADKLYESAIATFERQRDPQLVAVCLAYYARAATDTGHPRADEIFKRALAAVEADHANTTDAALLLGRLDLSGVGSVEGRRLEQWVFDRARNTISRKSLVTPKGAPLLVIEDDRNSKR